MPRLIEQHPTRDAQLTQAEAAELGIKVEQDFKLTPDRRARLQRILQQELVEAHSSRYQQERRWRENLRQYEGIPRHPVKNYPIENAPNVELNVSGIIVDTIYAQTLDILYGMSPLVRVRPAGIHGDLEDCANDFQYLCNRLADTEMGLRKAMNHSVLDCIKHGTGTYYIPWTERVRVTDINRITSRTPRIYSHPLEDTFYPGGCEDFDEWMPWFGIRQWLTGTQIELRRDAYGWDIGGAQATTATTETRRAREQAGMTNPSSQRAARMYDTYLIFGHFDVDGDGVERDLLIYYNHSGNKVLHATWNPYDTYPFELMRYQLREHLIYGIGVVEMCSQFQESATTILNEFMANAVLANNRAWAGPPGLVPGDTLRLRPGKYFGVTDASSIQALQLADVYPGSLQALGILNQYVERRTGVNEVSSPRPNSMLGNRTPGITALTLMQAANRRFATAFDSIREASGNAVRQGMYRYHERVRMGDEQVMAHISSLFEDPAKAQRVLQVLADRRFDEAMIIEMHASTATANAIQDRQDLIQIAGVLGSYYDKALQMISMASVQGISEPARAAAIQAANGISEIIKRALSRFDQIKDGERFVLDLEEQIRALPAAPTPVDPQLAGLLGMAPGGGESQGGGGPPAASNDEPGPASEGSN